VLSARKGAEDFKTSPYAAMDMRRKHQWLKRKPDGVYIPDDGRGDSSVYNRSFTLKAGMINLQG